MIITQESGLKWWDLPYYLKGKPVCFDPLVGGPHRIEFNRTRIHLLHREMGDIWHPDCKICKRFFGPNAKEYSLVKFPLALKDK